MSIHHSSVSPSDSYQRQPDSAPPSLLNGRNPGFTINVTDTIAPRYGHPHNSPQYGLNAGGSDALVSYCPCRTSSSPAYTSLSHQLQHTLQVITTDHGHHSHGTFCRLYRSVVELDHLLRGIESHSDSTSYASMSGTPTDSELMAPLSATGSHESFRHQDSPINGGLGGGPNVGTPSSPGDWNSLTGPPAYNPYFNHAVSQDGFAAYGEPA